MTAIMVGVVVFALVVLFEMKKSIKRRAKQMEQVEFNEEQVKEMAIFISQLVREGVRFKVTNKDSGWIVELTGGY